MAKKEDDEQILSKKGISLQHYRNLMKFSNHIKVVCRDDNFENCLIVLDFVKTLNLIERDTNPESSNLKQMHILLDAKNTFPSYS